MRDAEAIDELYVLIGDILREHCPGSAVGFERVGHALIASQLDRRPWVEGEPVEFGFAPTLETGLLITEIVVGTLSFVDLCFKVHRLKKDVASQHEFEREFNDRLIEHKVPRELSVKISVHYGPKLRRIVDNHQKRRKETNRKQRGKTG